MPDTEKDRLVQRLREIAAHLGVKSVGKREFLDSSGISERAVLTHFGTYNELVVAAGLVPQCFPTADAPTYSDQDLIDEIVQVLRVPGSKTTKYYFDANSKASSSAVERRFGGWLAALKRVQSQLDPVRDAALIVCLEDAGRRRVATHTVQRSDRPVDVTVPDENRASPEDFETEPSVRESAKIQALLGRIGRSMGMSIWIPKADRGLVLREWREADLLDRLPLNYDDTTLRTIENIDVLWMKGRSIVRAFEVEHTTSVYSGILRMADLLALQPNMDIRLHIVAPATKREKVFQEIQRPVFALLERKPLAVICTFLSYDSVRALAEQQHLSHLSDSVLDEYAEEAG